LSYWKTLGKTLVKHLPICF